MMDTSKHVKVCNLTDMQLPVGIQDAYNNQDTVLMQPHGKVDLPEGSTVRQPYPSGIQVTELPVAVAVVVEEDAVVAEEPVQVKSKTNKGDA